MISLKIKDPGKLAKNLIRRNKNFRRAVKRNFVIASDIYLNWIRQKYYSGRKGDDSGLNKITGDLSRYWLSEVIEEGLDIVGGLTSEMNYAIFHEEEGPRHPKHPKRTSVREDFTGTIGTGLYSRAVNDAMSEAY